MQLLTLKALRYMFVSLYMKLLNQSKNKIVMIFNNIFYDLAEWNKISGKCFSHTLLGPVDGFRSCDMWHVRAGSCFLLTTIAWPSHLPTLEFFSCSFHFWMILDCDSWQVHVLTLHVYLYILWSCSDCYCLCVNKGQACGGRLDMAPRGVWEMNFIVILVLFNSQP